MLVSVALCTYNGEKFLREQLESIMSQTFFVKEIVVCDDLSTDGTIHILNEYFMKYPKIFRIYLNPKSLGTIKNFEKAISLTSGDLIFLADQDDVWYLDKVEKIVNYFRLNQECQLLFTDGDLIDDRGESLGGTLWEKYNFDNDKRLFWKNNLLAFKELIKGNNKITGATLCFNKNLKGQIFPFKLPFGYWHDGWLGLHAAAAKGLFFLEESLIKYRVHSNQQVGISHDVKDVITIKANKNYISQQQYFFNLMYTYPYLKEYIPYKKKNLLRRLVLRFRFYFNFI